jgi:hypothetical protein
MTQVSDSQIVDAVLASPTLTAAAERLGICRQALHKRLRKPGVRVAVSDLERSRVAAVRAQMAAGLQEAVGVVRELLTADDPELRLRAADRILAAAKVLGLETVVSDDRHRSAIRHARLVDEVANLLRGCTADLSEDEIDAFASLAVEVREGSDWPWSIARKAAEAQGWTWPPGRREGDEMATTPGQSEST